MMKDRFGGGAGEKHREFMVGHRLHGIHSELIAAAENCIHISPSTLSTDLFLLIWIQKYICFPLRSPDHGRNLEFSPSHHTNKMHRGQNKGPRLQEIYTDL